MVVSPSTSRSELAVTVTDFTNRHLPVTTTEYIVPVADSDQNLGFRFGEEEPEIIIMWRRSSSKLLALRSIARPNRIVTPSPSPLTLRPSTTVLSRHFSGNVSKKVEDVMPIATGHEREELEAELQGRDILDINFPEGPFGTKEAPAVVKSYYDQRIVGCPGAEGEDEHDVVWFWLKKGQPHECPVCSQYFTLEVVGPGGLPDGLDEDDHRHH